MIPSTFTNSPFFDNCHDISLGTIKYSHIFEWVRFHNQDISLETGLDLAEDVLLPNQPCRIDRRTPQDGQRRQDFGPEGEFTRLRLAEGAQEVRPVADGHAGVVGDLEGLQPGLEHLLVLGHGLGREVPFPLGTGHLGVGDEGRG